MTGQAITQLGDLATPAADTTTQPLTVDAQRRLRVVVSGGSSGGTPNPDGSINSGGRNGTAKASETNPVPVSPVQGTVSQANVAITANTALTILAAATGTNFARVLNWTASPVYIASGASGTPSNSNGADFIPAAASGVPGQWESSFRPVDGLRAVGASSGNLSVISF